MAMNWFKRNHTNKDGHQDPGLDPAGLNTLVDGSTVHLALYKYDACLFCRRVLRAAEPLNVKFELRDTWLDRGRRKELRELTGRSTVPCLLVNGKPMFESADIIHWLERRFS